MTNAKHTPGPWSIDRGQIIGPQYYSGYRLADICGHKTTEGEANARLIAAAPDQNTVLLELEDWLVDHVPSDVAGRDYHLAAVRAAIAKAKGE